MIVAACCEDCDLEFWLPASVVVAHQPAVVAYYHAHDVAVDDGSLELPHVSGANGTVVSRDPVRIEVDVHAPGTEETLVVTIDEHATVVDTRREPATDRQPDGIDDALDEERS